MYREPRSPGSARAPTWRYVGLMAMGFGVYGPGFRVQGLRKRTSSGLEIGIWELSRWIRELGR